MEEKKEDGFKFVDRRGRVKEEGEEKEEEKKEEPEEKEEEKKEKEKEEEKEKTEEEANIQNLLKWFISILIGNTWVWLGLVKHPQTQKINKDLPQAKISIDCINFLYKEIESFLSELEKREIRSILAELQINFVNQSKLL